MTPMEKAEGALNQRIEQLQARLQEAKSEEARRFFVQSILVCLGLGECITDYGHAITQYAKARHAELKAAQLKFSAQHDELMKSGNEMLERLKANPTDRALRKEIETAQRHMATVQKSLRRGVDAFQREMSPSIGLMDKIAASLRRLGEAEDKEALKRATRSMLAHVQELYRGHPALPSSGAIDPAVWEVSAQTEIDEASDFYDAFSRAGFQAMLALQIMTLAIAPTAHTNEEVVSHAHAAVTQRLKTIAERFSAP